MEIRLRGNRNRFFTFFRAAIARLNINLSFTFSLQKFQPQNYSVFVLGHLSVIFDTLIWIEDNNTTIQYPTIHVCQLQSQIPHSYRNLITRLFAGWHCITLCMYRTEALLTLTWCSREGLTYIYVIHRELYICKRKRSWMEEGWKFCIRPLRMLNIYILYIKLVVYYWNIRALMTRRRPTLRLTTTRQTVRRATYCNTSMFTFVCMYFLYAHTYCVLFTLDFVCQMGALCFDALMLIAAPR